MQEKIFLRIARNRSQSLDEEADIITSLEAAGVSVRILSRFVRDARDSAASRIEWWGISQTYRPGRERFGMIFSLFSSSPRSPLLFLCSVYGVILGVLDSLSFFPIRATETKAASDCFAALVLPAAVFHASVPKEYLVCEGPLQFFFFGGGVKKKGFSFLNLLPPLSHS